MEHLPEWSTVDTMELAPLSLPDAQLPFTQRLMQLSLQLGMVSQLRERSYTLPTFPA